MSKSSFYHFFENKAGLFRRTLDHTFAPIIEALSEFEFAALNAQTFWPALKDMVHSKSRAAVLSPEMDPIGRMAFRSIDDPEERDLTSDLIEFSTNWQIALIRRGRELGLVRPDLPEDLLISLLMKFSMAFDRWLLEHWNSLTEGERV